MVRPRGPVAVWFPVGALAVGLLCWVFVVGRAKTGPRPPTEGAPGRLVLASLDPDARRGAAHAGAGAEWIDAVAAQHTGEDEPYGDPALDAAADLQEDSTSSTTLRPIPFRRTQPRRSPAGPVNVVIIAEGGTASVQLLHALGRIPSSFALDEPFKNFKYGGAVLNGSFATLFDCGFASNGTLLSEVAWAGAAREHLASTFNDSFAPPDDNAAEYHARLMAARGALSPEDSEPILRWCLASATKVVHTIRFTGYIRILPKAVMNERLRVIHVLRHPASTIGGGAAARNTGAGANIANTTWGTRVKELCERVDGGIRALESQLPSQQLLFLRHEDLLRTPAAATKIAFDFVDARFTPEMHRWVLDNHDAAAFSPADTDPPPRAPQLGWPKDLVEGCKDTLRAGGYL